MSLLITGGRVITASDDYVADVYCADGIVQAIGRDLPAQRFQAGRTIDASGKYVIPGGIDVHTHLNMPFGGTTWSGSLFLAADTFAGPAYFGLGKGEGDRWSLYLLLGAP